MAHAPWSGSTSVVNFLQQQVRLRTRLFRLARQGSAKLFDDRTGVLYPTIWPFKPERFAWHQRTEAQTPWAAGAGRRTSNPLSSSENRGRLLASVTGPSIAQGTNDPQWAATPQRHLVSARRFAGGLRRPPPICWRCVSLPRGSRPCHTWLRDPK